MIIDNQYPGQAAPAPTLDSVVHALCRHESYGRLARPDRHHVPLPSVEALAEMENLLRSVLFPGYFGSPDLRPDTMRGILTGSLARILVILSEQIKRGLCLECAELTANQCGDCEQRSRQLAMEFIGTLPCIRERLASDVDAAFEGDPAARSREEVIFCYPSLRAMTDYRIAHELHRLGVPFIPRILSESAHAATGIDIHPGAGIGERFFMDHGTGIVIGETAIIGRNVRLYQGVTLGARSFPLDEQGRPVKGIARHPVVEDDVTIYAGATILGRITIGRGSVIGGNVWITQCVPPGSKILQVRPGSPENGASGSAPPGSRA